MVVKSVEVIVPSIIVSVVPIIGASRAATEVIIESVEVVIAPVIPIVEPVVVVVIAEPIEIIVASVGSTEDSVSVKVIVEISTSSEIVSSGPRSAGRSAAVIPGEGGAHQEAQQENGCRDLKESSATVKEVRIRVSCPSSWQKCELFLNELLLGTFLC